MSEAAKRPSRDGVSGLVDADRALRAREVSHPSAADREAVTAQVAAALARVHARRKRR